MGKDSGLFKGLGSLFNSPSGIPSASEMSGYNTEAFNQLTNVAPGGQVTVF